MVINITGCKYVPRWDSLQTIVKEATNSEGRFIRISRKDNGCNYTAPGEYEVEYLKNDGSITNIDLTVTG